MTLLKSPTIMWVCLTSGDMARQAFRTDHASPGYSRKLTIKALFNADDAPFVTSASDTGWEISPEETDL